MRFTFILLFGIFKCVKSNEVAVIGAKQIIKDAPCFVEDMNLGQLETCFDYCCDQAIVLVKSLNDILMAKVKPIRFHIFINANSSENPEELKFLSFDQKYKNRLIQIV